jgi:serine/threonine protein kinase
MMPHDPSEHVENMPGVGDLIGGRYRLESVIGHGALGTVMRAQHITMGGEFAVKLLRPEISNHPTIRRRLIQRVHQAQALHHPNNCRLYDFGQAAGSLYLVSELLYGATLQTIIERGAPYPVGWVIDIGMQMLDGLGEAHDHNFVHRNLKPRNIFLLPRRHGGQQVKILDYGLASSLDSLPQDDEEDDDREAEICGTAAYLAPETLVKQVSGKPTDVYAVGLILIEMLTGEQVFRGDSLAQVLYRQIHTSVRLPAKLAWTSLGKVLLKAVSKHPDNRYPDADAFYDALEEASDTTASYFRLDPSDLEPEDEPMSPDLLARLLKKQRRGRRSDRDGGDGGDDSDADDAEPEAFSQSSAESFSQREEASSVFPLTPPPIPIPHREPKADPSPGPPGRRLRGRDASDEGSRAPGMRVTHPLREVGEAETFPRMSFPRHEAHERAKAPCEQDDNQAPAAGRVEDWRRWLADQWTVAVESLDRGGWARRAPLVAFTLLLSLAGVGLYLILS